MSTQDGTATRAEVLAMIRKAQEVLVYVAYSRDDGMYWKMSKAEATFQIRQQPDHIVFTAQMAEGNLLIG